MIRPTRSLLLALLLLGGAGLYRGAAQAPAPAPAAPLPAAPPAPAPATETPTPGLLAPAPTPSAEPANTAPSSVGLPSTEAAGEPTLHEQAGNCVEGSEQACMALTRSGKDGKERRILVIRTGTQDDTGVYTICGPRDDDPEGTPNIGVFSEQGAGGIRITIDKNVIRVPLAQVIQRPAKDGEEGSDGQIEASAGTARLLDAAPEGAKDQLSLCGVEVAPTPAPDTVFVTQGKTQLKGQKLTYDETDGVARIDGPITFKRDNEKDPLSGSSERIDVNVDEETTTLIGNVVLTSKGGRVSKAPRVQYDDATNTARLYGTLEQPATSVKGNDSLTLTQGYLLYDLDTNNVVARADEGGNVTGEFEDTGEATTDPVEEKK
ncbi:LptA/OstA family protein [Deinococcus fonticola]|uniref:LptA/OstA family protein n=1 Tax=Deinococcus fonticola TaxID=2528713 RepID=UPI001074DEBD|nr:LptA/OstA family protein [Deinococcus fonticola]